MFATTREFARSLYKDLHFNVNVPIYLLPGNILCRLMSVARPPRSDEGLRMPLAGTPADI